MRGLGAPKRQLGSCAKILKLCDVKELQEEKKKKLRNEGGRCDVVVRCVCFSHHRMEIPEIHAQGDHVQINIFRQSQFCGYRSIVIEIFSTLFPALQRV